MDAHPSLSSSSNGGDPPFPPPGWTAELTSLPGTSRVYAGYAASLDDTEEGLRGNDTSSLLIALKAKHRASILWLLSKAFDNRIPLEIQDPYYKDHEGEDCLKPFIVQGLASAELYCLALSHIYQDHQYSNLSHQQIMTHLMRRGIYIQDPQDTSLTESVLIQTAPIKMSAHMVILEAMMSLYIKEVLIPAKVVEVVNRFLPVDPEMEDLPEEPEDAAIFWINKSCQKFKERIEEELESTTVSTREDDQLTVPSLPPVEYLWDLSDGCSIAALFSFYCPDDLSWKEICFNEPMSTADSIYNLQLIQMFCEEKLPCDIFFLGIEDFFDCHRVVRPNVLAFVADLLFHFEISPVECVRQPVHHFNPLLLTSEDDEETQIHQMNVRKVFNSSSSRRQSLSGQIQQPMQQTTQQQVFQSPTFQPRHLMLSPSEMRTLSLQHSSPWGDSPVVTDQRRKGSAPSMSSSQTPSNRRWTKGRSQEYRDSVDEEELSKYFSALDIPDASFDSPPEYVHIPNNNQRNNGHHPQPQATPSKTSTYSRGTSPIKQPTSRVVGKDQNDVSCSPIEKPATTSHSVIHNTPIQRVSSGCQTNMTINPMTMSVTSALITSTPNNQATQQQLSRLQGSSLTFNKRTFEDDGTQTADMDLVTSPDIWHNNSRGTPRGDGSLQHNSLTRHEIDRLEVVEYDPASLDRVKEASANNESNGHHPFTHPSQQTPQKRGGWFTTGDHAEPSLTTTEETQQTLPTSTNTSINSPNIQNKRGGTFIDIPWNDTPVKGTPPSHRLSSSNLASSANHSSSNNKLTVNLSKATVLSTVKTKEGQQQSIVASQQQPPSVIQSSMSSSHSTVQQAQQHHPEEPPVLMVIGSDLNTPDPESETSMARKKEAIMQQCLKRKAEQESKRIQKQEELARKREAERRRSEEMERKKEEEKARKAKILEEYRTKKAVEEDEAKNGGSAVSSGFGGSSRSTLRSAGSMGSRTSLNRSRPKSLHVSSASIRDFASLDPRPTRVSKAGLTPSTPSHAPSGANGTPSSDQVDRAPPSTGLFSADSGIVGSSRPASSLSSCTSRNFLTSPSSVAMPSMPPLYQKKPPVGGPPSDGASDVGSAFSEYNGPKLYVKPTQKSNRGIILNAINVVLAGTVNADTKKKVLEEISKSDSKQFVILFRGQGLQFRAIYSYNPDTDEAIKLHGMGPKNVSNEMIDKFYKYNSGTKNFGVVHTKHLSITIDGFTIHNHFWMNNAKPRPVSMIVK